MLLIFSFQNKKLQKRGLQLRGEKGRDRERERHTRREMVESPGLVCLLTIVCIINGFIGKEKASMGV